MPQHSHPWIATVLLGEVAASLRTGIIHGDDPTYLRADSLDDIKHPPCQAIARDHDRYVWRG